MNKMVYFFVNISNNDISKLQGSLPKDCFCLFQLQPGSTRYYGMVKKGSLPQFVKALPEETATYLEYVEENVFKLFFLQNIGESISCVGNRRLLIHLSDE
jgi:hypothetical protein